MTTLSTIFFIISSIFSIAGILSHVIEEHELGAGLSVTGAMLCVFGFLSMAFGN